MVTGGLAIAVLFTLLRPQSVLDFLASLPFYLGPALLVAVGSYLHAIRRKTSGLILLLASGSILTVGALLATLGGVFYFYGIWGGLLGLTPSAMAIITMIASLLVKRFTIAGPFEYTVNEGKYL